MLRLLIPFLSLVILGCSLDPRAQDCTRSGGTWERVRDCPSACDPPTPTSDNCAMLDELACITGCGDQPSCACPPESPF